MTRYKEIYPDDSAFPVPTGCGGDEGLTKREYMAAGIFSAIITARIVANVSISNDSAKQAAMFTDMLIDALNDKE